MFRYIYPLNKRAKKLMKNGSTLEWTFDYPKDPDLEWYDTTGGKGNKFKVDQPAFTFEEATYNKKNIEGHKRTGESTFDSLFS